uniref:BZIP domain-containing protein n=1 Tax=Panagrolaimus superbus TaxID=310955 RepID=A0A914XYZ8_9BILA
MVKITKKPATDAEKEKRKLATRRCREKQALELQNLETRRKNAMNENETLMQKIRAIEMLIEWMRKAARQ